MLSLYSLSNSCSFSLISISALLVVSFISCFCNSTIFASVPVLRNTLFAKYVFFINVLKCLWFNKSFTHVTRDKVYVSFPKFIYEYRIWFGLKKKLCGKVSFFNTWSMLWCELIGIKNFVGNNDFIMNCILYFSTSVWSSILKF